MTASHEPRGRRVAALLTALVAVRCSAPATLHLEAPNAIGPYSAAVATGELVFVAGKIGSSGATFAEEAASAIDRVAEELARLGLSLADVVSVNVFLTDMALFEELNAAYAARFPAPHPARTTVGVAALPRGARVEIQAIARRR